jgi:phosphatidylinositol glycan class A protein
LVRKSTKKASYQISSFQILEELSRICIIYHSIFSLTSQLTQLGHKIVILTHEYKPNRVGIRYLTSGVKVYYIPQLLVYDQVSLPTVFSNFPLFRYIMIREHIQIVHCHQAFSSISHEAILHAKTMGLKVIFTDHSLFGNTHLIQDFRIQAQF